MVQLNIFSIALATKPTAQTPRALVQTSKLNLV